MSEPWTQVFKTAKEAWPFAGSELRALPFEEFERNFDAARAERICGLGARADVALGQHKPEEPKKVKNQVKKKKVPKLSKLSDQELGVLVRSARVSVRKGAPTATGLLTHLAPGRSNPFAELQGEVEVAEAAFAKARKSGDSTATRRAGDEVLRTRRALAGMKFVAAEGARDRDPSMAARSRRGQGVPLISVRDQLGEDPDLKAL